MFVNLFQVILICIYRDLKPSNIMLVNNSHGVILDFGSMTPASISMTTRSEAQRWQVTCQN